MLFEAALFVALIGAAWFSIWMGLSKMTGLLVIGGSSVGILFGVLLAWRFFDWYNRKVITDPVFESLEYRQGAWYGIDEVQGMMTVAVFADESGPSNHQKKLFIDVKEKWSELQKTIELPLYNAYQECRLIEKIGYEEAGGDFPQTFDTDFPCLDQASDIWEIAHLAAVLIQGDNKIDFELIYSIDWGRSGT